MKRHQSWIGIGAAACLVMTALAVPVVGETVWGGIWQDAIMLDEMQAQRFNDYGDPDLILGNNFDTFGFHWNLAVSGATLYSGVNYAIHQWDANTGEEIGPLQLDEPLENHLEDFLSGIGSADNGDLLFGAAGMSTQQRTLARYTADGHWVRDYSAPELQHRQGSAAADSDAVFIASRHNMGGGWLERILMFKTDGTYVGAFGEELGNDVGDVALMGDSLYSMNYIDGIYVYDLNGVLIPTFSHKIPFPPGVNPDAFALDSLGAAGGFLYVGDSPTPIDPDAVWFKIDLLGEIVGQYDAKILVPNPMLGNFLGSVVVVPEAGVECDKIKKLKAKCVGKHHKVKAKVKSSLEEGTALTLTLDDEKSAKVNVNAKGKAKAKWRNEGLGEHEVCIDECPDICAKTICE